MMTRTLDFVLFDAFLFYESFAKSENVQYEQKIQWKQTYGGSEDDYAHALIQTADGDFVLAGVTSSFGVGREDMWLIKTDANGIVQWNQTYGGTEKDTAEDLIQTADEGFALVGETRSYGAGTNDMWLVKTDANGVAQWNQTYGGTESDDAHAVLQTADGGFALVGSTVLDGTGRDMFLVKTDANGVAQWNQTYGRSGESDDAHALVQTADEGFALAGYIHSLGLGAADFSLVKTDENGTLQWHQTYGGIGFEQAHALLQTVDGGFALAGNGLFDMLLIKTDANGVAQWNQTYGRSGESDYAHALIQIADGDFVLAGVTNSFGVGGGDMWLVKTDVNGTLQWHQTFGGSGFERAHALLQSADGSFVLTGIIDDSDKDESDIWFVKTTPTSALDKLIAPFLTLNLIGLVYLVLILVTLILIIKKQKLG